MMKLKTEIVSAIIESFREFNKTLPEIQSVDGIVSLADIGDVDWESPIAKKLVKQIADLDNETRAELTALMWLGRDEGEADDFTDLVKHAQNISKSPVGDAHYLIEKRDLDTFFEAGLQKLSK
jgi:hypothetical protein